MQFFGLRSGARPKQRQRVKKRKIMNDITPHSNEWYDRLFKLQGGYFYPWKSELPQFNGEDTYLDILHKHLNTSLTVLDIGCGHGDIPISIAPYVKHVYAYDRVHGFIERATQEQIRLSLTNITFKCSDSKSKDNVRMPFEENSIDLFISRRGPTHWIKDAKRVAKSNAYCLALLPVSSPALQWNNLLPDSLKLDITVNKTAQSTFISNYEANLKRHDIELVSSWYFDVPEVLASSFDFYKYLSFGKSPDKIPSYDSIKFILDDIILKHGSEGKIEIRHVRYLWKGRIK